ncbi:MAG: tetratricopeptide repeat protein [Xenococcaceae cyanobacterium MO_188.B32]|nr:tetratricopeptide repeat protein [Xenococcaceae cyanobacterium MO_188.B32]
MRSLPLKLTQIIGAFLITIALETIPLNAQPVQSQSAEEYLERGLNLSEQNEFVEAVEAYSQAIDLDPDNALAYYNRGLAFYYLRNHGAALADFNQTIELKPDVAATYEKRGLILMYLEDYEGAIADFEQAAQLTPDDAHLYLGKGLATVLEGKIAKAIPDFDRAIELDPNLAIAYFLRGGAYSELGDRLAALTDYQQAGRLYQKLENRTSFNRVMAIVRDLVPNCYPNCNRTADNDSIPTDSDLLISPTIAVSIANLGERISFGDKILVDELTNPDKQAGVKALAVGDFATAVTKLEAYLQQYPNDPEALIYLNNARIGNSKSYSIAVSVPIDSLTPNALEILRGVAQAQAENNNKVGISLKVAIAADNNNPEMTKQLGSVLGENPDILGIVGPFSSDAALVAGEVYKQKQLVAISPTSTSVKLSNYSPYFFRTAPNDTVAAQALANYATDELKVEKAAIFFNSKSGYSQSLKQEFLLAISQRGGTIVTAIDLSNPNFKARESIDLAQKKGAEVLMLAVDTPKLDRALKVVEANSQKLPILGGDAVIQAKTREIGGKNAVGMVLASPWALKNDSQSNFLRRARSLWGEEVGWRTALAYDATQALIAAIENNPTRVGVRQALTAPSFSANGASDTINFLPSGDRLTSVKLVRLVSSPKDKYGYNFVPLSN